MSVRMFEGASDVRIGKSSFKNYGGDYHDHRTTYKGNASNNTRTYHQEGAGTIYNGDISGNINTFNGGSHEHNSGPAQKQGRRDRKARAPTLPAPSSSGDSDDDSDPNNLPSQRNRHRQEPPRQYGPPRAQNPSGYAQCPANDYRTNGGNYYDRVTVNQAPVNNVRGIENGNFGLNHGNTMQNRGDPPPGRDHGQSYPLFFNANAYHGEHHVDAQPDPYHANGPQQAGAWVYTANLNGGPMDYNNDSASQLVDGMRDMDIDEPDSENPVTPPQEPRRPVGSNNPFRKFLPQEDR